MSWRPETFTPEQRRAAAKTVVRAQVLVDQLDRNEFGRANAELITHVYSRIDDMLAMLYEDLYAFDDREPQAPSAS